MGSMMSGGVIRCQRGCPVLRRGGLSWTDVVGVKGVRDAKESKSVSCEVGCEMVSSFRLQDVASMEWCPTRHVVLQRVLVRWSIPVYQAVVMSPCSSSRLKRPSVCSVRSCRSMACWKTRPKSMWQGFHCRL